MPCNGCRREGKGEWRKGGRERQIQGEDERQTERERESARIPGTVVAILVQLVDPHAAILAGSGRELVRQGHCQKTLRAFSELALAIKT